MGVAGSPLMWLVKRLQGNTLDPDDYDVRKDIDKLKKLPDAEKIKLMDSVAELAGGTVGALSGGGLASIPAAGAGAVAGRNLVSRPIARAMGLKEEERTPGEELGDTAKVFAINAAGEGVGRLIPAAAKTVSTAVRNAIKGAVKPIPEAEVLAALAKRHGVELNLSQRSGRPWLQSAELVLDRSPFSSAKMKGFRQKQYGQFQDSINKYLDSLHAGEISMEDFARLAEDSVTGLQKKFNVRMATGADAAAKQLSAKPFSDIETAEVLKAGKAGNLDRVRTWANRSYGKLRGEHGNTEIDLTPFHESAKELLAPIPEEAVRQLFPPRVLKLLETSSKQKSLPLSDVADRVAKEYLGKPYAALDQLEQQQVMEIAGQVAKESAPQSAKLSLSEAMRTRSELLEQARNLSGEKNSQYRRYLLELSDSLNTSMEESLANTPGKEKAYKELQGLNKQYRSYMEQLMPPRAPGQAGNIAAKTLNRSDIPEKLPEQLTASETMTRKTMEAVDPANTAATGVPPKNAIDPKQALRRNRFDATREEATLRDPATGESRLSPTAMAEELPEVGAVDALYGAQSPSVAGLAKPALVGREKILFQSPLSKSVKSPDARRVFDAAFPKRGFGGEVQDTLDVMTEAGRLPETRRAYAEGILRQGEQRIPSIGDTKVTGPRKLENVVDQYGDTTKKVLGPRGEKKFQEFEDLGKGITEAEALRGNASGTAQMQQNIGLWKRLLSPSEYPGLIKEGAVTAAAGNRFTDPAKHNWMFDKPETLLGGADYPLSGATGRAATSLPFDVGKPSEESIDELERKALENAIPIEDLEREALANATPTPNPAAARARPPMPNAAPEWAGQGEMPVMLDRPPQDATRATQEAVRPVAPGQLTPIDERKRRNTVRPLF